MFEHTIPHYISKPSRTIRCYCDNEEDDISTIEDETLNRNIEEFPSEDENDTSTIDDETLFRYIDEYLAEDEASEEQNN